jgi:hypothetical protein
MAAQSSVSSSASMLAGVMLLKGSAWRGAEAVAAAVAPVAPLGVVMTPSSFGLDGQAGSVAQRAAMLTREKNTLSRLTADTPAASRASAPADPPRSLRT